MEETTSNRTRSRQVKFWVSEEEYDLLQKKLKATGGVHQGAYIRKMILDGYIINLEIPELKESIRLLSITSNNVNQIARRLNADGRIHQQDLAEVQMQLEQNCKLQVGAKNPDQAQQNQLIQKEKQRKESANKESSPK